MKNMKMKLWKVTVNNIGWNCPQTFYAESRIACEEIARKFPASDPVKYAGNFRKENAEELLELWMKEVGNE